MRAPITRTCPLACAHMQAPSLWFAGWATPIPIPGGPRVSALAEGEPDPPVTVSHAVQQSCLACGRLPWVLPRHRGGGGVPESRIQVGVPPAEQSGTTLSYARVPCSGERPVRLDKDMELAGLFTEPPPRFPRTNGKRENWLLPRGSPPHSLVLRGQLMPGPGAEEEGPRWLGGCGDREPVLPALCKATRKAVRSPIARQVLLCQALARAGDTVHVPGWGVAEHSQALGMGES